MTLHPAVARTPVQPALDVPLVIPAVVVDTSRIPTRIRNGGAAPRTCPHCGAWVLTEWAPGHVDVDPHRVPTALAEYELLATGATTYTLHGTPRDYLLLWRSTGTRWLSRHEQPTAAVVVVTQHTCGRPPPAGWDPVPLWPTTLTTPTDGPPPY